MTEFQVMHHFKALEMLISLIYQTCDFKVVCSRYSAIIYISKSCALLAANSRTLSYYLVKTEAVIAFWHEYYAL